MRVSKIQSIHFAAEDVEPGPDGVVHIPAEIIGVVQVDDRPCRIAAVQGQIENEPSVFESLVISAMCLQGAKRIAIACCSVRDGFSLARWKEFIQRLDYPHGVILLTGSIEIADDAMGVVVTATDQSESFEVSAAALKKLVADRAPAKIDYILNGATSLDDMHRSRRVQA